MSPPSPSSPTFFEVTSQISPTMAQPPTDEDTLDQLQTPEQVALLTLLMSFAVKAWATMASVFRS
jgi:hypothetical protein